MKGQIAVPMIIGIMLLAVALLIFFVGGQKKADVGQRDVSEIASFVSGTLDLGFEECLAVIGMQGGWYQPASFFEAGTARIGYAWQGHNTLIGIDRLSQELVTCIEDQLRACLSWESFRDIGFEIESSKPVASVLLGASDVSASLKMPLSVKIGEQQQRFEDFGSEKIGVRLSHLHSIAADITELRARQENQRDFDLSHLGGLDVSTAIYEEGSEQVYVLSDPQSRIETEQYEFVFANSFQT